MFYSEIIFISSKGRFHESIRLICNKRKIVLKHAISAIIVKFTLYACKFQLSQIILFLKITVMRKLNLIVE